MNELFQSVAIELAAAIGEDDDHARMVANIMSRAASKGQTPAAAIVTGVFRAFRSVDPRTVEHLLVGDETCNDCAIWPALHAAKLEGLEDDASPCNRCASAWVQRFIFGDPESRA